MASEKQLAKMDSVQNDTRSISPPMEKADPSLVHDGGESKVTTKSIVVGATITIGGFLFGYDIGVISGILIMPSFARSLGPSDTVSENDSSLLVGLLGAGTLVGSLAQGPISDWFGRKIAMLIWAAVFTIGALVQTTFETSLAQIVIGRFIAGMGVGALSGLCPLYLGETAPAKIRGAIVSCYQLNIIFGICVSYAITWATSTRGEDLTTSLGWRIPIGMQLLWGVLLFGCMLLIPESPRWYLMKNRPDDARRVMAGMRAVELRPDGTSATEQLRGDAALESDLRDMDEGIRAEQAAFAGTNWFTAWAVLFGRQQKMWYRTILGMMLMFFQQLNGQNFLYYFGPTVTKGLGLSLNSYALQFVFGMVSFVMTIPAIWLVERIGRRRGLIFGAFAQASCALIIGLVGHYQLPPPNADVVPGTLSQTQKTAGNVFIAFAVIFLALFSMFWGPICWVALSELFPSPLRARGIGLGSASNWFWNMLLGLFSNKIAGDIGTLIMVVFGCIDFAAGCFVTLAYPELKGLTLEQVDNLFTSGVSAWNSSKWTAEQRQRKHDQLKAGAIGA